MLTIVLVVLALLALLHAYREYWRLRTLPQLHHADFEGEMMKVGATFIARRPACNNSRHTIVCFPGFLEDMRYFQALYEDSDAELILVNNANYHCPFDSNEATLLDWPENPHPMGSIEHDAFYLGLVLKHLAGGTTVRLHGHSRGGAVVLETGRQYPGVTSSSERPINAILEAPVLPQARTAGKASDPLPHRITCYFMPILFGLLRNISEDRLLKMPMMRPTTALKTELCRSVFSTSRSYATCVKNVQSIVKWQRTKGFELYDNFPQVTVVIGERDSSLDRRSMLASASEGQARNSGVYILETTGTNHFVSLEQPDTIRAIAQGA